MSASTEVWFNSDFQGGFRGNGSASCREFYMRDTASVSQRGSRHSRCPEDVRVTRQGLVYLLPLRLGELLAALIKWVDGEGGNVSTAEAQEQHPGHPATGEYSSMTKRHDEIKRRFGGAWMERASTCPRPLLSQRLEGCSRLRQPQARPEGPSQPRPSLRRACTPDVGPAEEGTHGSTHQHIVHTHA